VPRLIAHREIDSEITLAHEMMAVLPLAGARNQHVRLRRQSAREGRHPVFDLAFEVQDVTPQGLRQAVGETRIAHRGRASFPIPECCSPQRRRDAEISAEKTRTSSRERTGFTHFAWWRAGRTHSRLPSGPLSFFSALISAPLRLCSEDAFLKLQANPVHVICVSPRSSLWNPRRMPLRAARRVATPPPARSR